MRCILEMGFEDWEFWEKAVAVLVVIVVIIGVLWWFSSQNSSPELVNPSPQLTFSLDTYSAKSMTEILTYLNVVNNGDLAEDLTITLESDAFESITLNSFDVPASETKTAMITLSIQDVNNQNYPVEITYSCNGASDSYKIPKDFCVLPDISFIEVRYQPDIPLIEVWNNIKPDESIDLGFKIKSNSENAVYDNLYVVLTIKESPNNFIITPNQVNIEPIASQGATQWGEPYRFHIEANGTAIGDYTLNIIAYYDDYQVANETKTLVIYK